MNTINKDCLYDIIRFYSAPSKATKRQGGIWSRVILRNLTLEEAQKHCNDPETSSSTCTLPSRKSITKRHGAWFDAYQVSKS